MLKVVVCVSGGGTNLQAILDAMDAGKITNTEITAVISNNPGARALDRAKGHGIPGIVMSPKEYESRDSFNEAFTAKMEELAPDLIVLAGFLVKIPESMVAKFSGRIINIHPSLIPAFCGVRKTARRSAACRRTVTRRMQSNPDADRHLQFRP